MSSKESEVRNRIQQLHVEHHDMDVVIQRLANDPSVDQLMITRLKKKKLQLKDMISKLENQLIPDDIA
jgi:hypothetical protein